MTLLIGVEGGLVVSLPLVNGVGVSSVPAYRGHYHVHIIIM